jgi:hypothetical protein
MNKKYEVVKFPYRIYFSKLHFVSISDTYEHGFETDYSGDGWGNGRASSGYLTPSGFGPGFSFGDGDGFGSSSLFLYDNESYGVGIPKPGYFWYPKFPTPKNEAKHCRSETINIDSCDYLKIKSQSVELLTISSQGGGDDEG